MEYPKARVEGLVISKAGGDQMVYDQYSQVLHSLNAVTATVWRHCDGAHSVTGIAEASGVTIEATKSALVKLTEARLMEGSHVAQAAVRQSRRRALKGAGVAVAGPIILSVTVQSAMAANSQCSGALIGTRYEDCTARPNCCDEGMNLICVPYEGGGMICDFGPSR